MLLQAANALGFKTGLRTLSGARIHRLALPCLALLKSAQPATSQSSQSVGPELGTPENYSLALVIKADGERVLFFEASSQTPTVLPIAKFAVRFTGQAVLFAIRAKPIGDKDLSDSSRQEFGFRWFIPELLKYKAIWRDVLLASLTIQLMALATPLFTQVVIDKVVVHHTLSTLTVIGVALAVFMIFTAAMTWVRHYLILHTGNRVDAVLAIQVFEHLFKLPHRYFEHRPTGVIAARFQGVETIREFIAGAAVTLILDLPFLAVFLGIMFTYSVELSLITLAMLGIIVGISLVVAPLFRERLNQQFLLGARNQAFLTEFVAGMETVKSLQMEPQLKTRFGDYLAAYLQAGFKTRQLANSYNVAANTLEQLLTLALLWVGAYTVMTSTDFTIGMLVAFQMFAGRLSQPLLRLVGLWQQFQQANIAVKRLGDVMNAPAEPYSLTPFRESSRQGLVEIKHLSFRYAPNLPFLYRDFNLTLKPGSCIALMGPSGCGKSTLAKLLQGFYLSSDGQIMIDGRDIRYLSANELRSHFGVVPQETILFSGTIYDNLILANPHASFEQVIQACKMAEIHDLIEKLPQGYQTEIGERGIGLSGGQKQRLAIARALLKRPMILIFDEATSNLDHQTAEQFVRTINGLKGKVTMLFITHQLPKGLNVDEVVRIGLKFQANESDAGAGSAEIYGD
jgi:subfamily B ATP-binding cassette protein HlyB/CyaB